MGTPITFNTIDVSSRVPRHAMEFDTTSGVRALPVNAKKLLVCGQRLAAGTVAAAVPTPIFRATDSEGYFGAGSILDLMCKAAIKANPDVDLTAVAMDDAGGATAATETLTIATTATSTGSFAVDVCDQELLIAVASGDTPTVQASALAAAINANTTLPVTATPVAGVVTFTSKNKGTVCNGIQLATRIVGPTGSTYTLSNAGSNGYLSGGTGAAVPTTALNAAASTRYHDISVGLNDTTGATAARDYALAQGAAEVGLGEVAIHGVDDTVANLTTMATTLNGERSLLAALRNSPSWTVQTGAAMGAVMASETVPNRPYNYLVLNGIKPPPVQSRWIKSEQKALLANGITPLVVIPGEKVAILRAESTRTKNAQAVTDMSESDITVIQAFDYVRDAMQAMFSTKYGRSRWADDDSDGLLPADVATPDKVKQDLIGTLYQLEGAGIVENVGDLLDQVVVNKVGTNCQYSIPTDLIDGLQEIYGKAVLTQFQAS
jgi:phage tail sheath gpL-like